MERRAITMEIQISKNFKLSEFLYSDTAVNKPRLLRAQNNISDAVYLSISNLVKCVLQPLRDKVGFAITINSGYRCLQLNEVVGGSSSSQHIKGEASDITCLDNKMLYEALLSMDFDQLIVYGSRQCPRFIHVSYTTSRKNRKMILYKK